MLKAAKRYEEVRLWIEASFIKAGGEGILKIITIDDLVDREIAKRESRK